MFSLPQNTSTVVQFIGCWFFFYMEKGNVNQLPEIIAKYKEGSSNSTDVLIFWEHISNS